MYVNILYYFKIMSIRTLKYINIITHNV